MTDTQANTTVRALVAGIVSLLLSINIFFVKRLVDEIDSTKATVHRLHEAVALISYRLDKTRDYVEARTKCDKKKEVNKYE